jgi:general secretion pathway protein G
MRDRSLKSVIGREKRSGSGEIPLPDSYPALRILGRRRSETGFTLLELIITLAIISILAATTIPVARNVIKRNKELELRRNLREMRMAIDRYNVDCNMKLISPFEVDAEDQCYPKNLEVLVKGVKANTSASGQIDKTLKYLRRLPNDPFTGKPDWGVRSMDDEPDSLGSGKYVWDVYSNAPGTALDGKTKYRDF